MGADTIGPTLVGSRIVLGVTGSIAAYKTVSLLRALMREGATVDVVMTQSATKFITPLTFEVLSGRTVTTDLFEAHQEMKHLTLPEQADAMVVAPATANFLAKAALGIGDDLLSTMLLTAQCPLIFAPAMDGGMWSHQTVAEHVRTLRARGVWVVDPEEGPLASGRVGQGRLAEESRILDALRSALAPKHDWQGHRVLVSAGPTQEPIDPVRYISEPLVRKNGLCHRGSGEETGSSGGAGKRPDVFDGSSRRGSGSGRNGGGDDEGAQHTVELVDGRHHVGSRRGLSPEASRIPEAQKAGQDDGDT